MNDQGVSTSSSAEDTCESVFVVSAVLGTVAGVVASSVCSAQWLGGAFAEALAIVGAVLGCSLFGAIGAVVVGPAYAALVHHRHAPAPAEVEEQPATRLGDAAMT
jgi:uncharacterized membrane protein YeaQ/YmgE (transglycosylase-associated protein family)